MSCRLGWDTGFWWHLWEGQPRTDPIKGPLLTSSDLHLLPGPLQRLSYTEPWGTGNQPERRGFLPWLLGRGVL